MSHNWNCPDDYEARRRARDDASFDLRYGSGRYDYRSPFECDEGNYAYQREYRNEADRLEEERAEERRRERAREERRQEEEYWAQQAEEEARLAAEEEAYWAEQAELHYAELAAAQGTEAGTAETEGLGPKDDGPVAEGDAP